MKIIETERLLLRWLSLEDAEFMRELLNDPSFLRFIGDRGVRTVDDARNYLLKGPLDSYARLGFGLYLVELKETGDPIGICGLLKRDSLDDVDIGFALLPEYWLKGYAFESASAVIAHGKAAFGLTRILAVTQPDNVGSIRTLEKLGMRFEKMVRLADEEPEIELFALDA